MKVLLLNPPSNGAYNRLGLKFPPLGLGYLASVLRQRGHWVDIIDFNVQKLSLSNLPWEEWDIVGISGDTSSHSRVMKIAGAAKEAGKTVVVGGYHASFREEEVLKSGIVDFVVKGEGEESFAELVDCLEEKGNLAKVSNLAYWRDGRVLESFKKEPPADLNKIPWPARDLLSMSLYRSVKLEDRRITTLVTSRGCPYSCSFCCSSAFAGRRWRSRDINDVVWEIEHLANDYNFGAVAFLDDNFTLNVNRLKLLCEEMIKLNLDLKWWCFSRVDTLRENEEIIDKMARAGARMIFLGLESGSQKILNAYNKEMQLEASEKVIRILREYDIKVWGSFILGSPDEKLEDLRATVNHAIHLNPDIAEFAILTPYPGTKLFKQAEEQGLIVSRDWSKYDGSHAVMKTKYLSPFQISRETARAYIKFYCRPLRWGQVWSGIKNKLLSWRY